MKIDSFNIEQQSMSKYQRVEKQQFNIQIQQAVPVDILDISDEGIALNEEDVEPEDFLSEEDKRKIQLLETFISWLTGKEFKFSTAYIKGNKGAKSKKMHSVQQPRGFAMRIQSKQEVYEKESMTFKSSGIVKTEDGRTIDFDLNLHMSREAYEANEINIQVGNFQDPLVLNYDGKGIDFSDQKLRIDVDLDGQIDNANFLAQGSGFLAYDRNKNGLIDDGTELFGPQTNNGFEELRAFDGDNNAWIDENDDIFSSLKLWTLNDAGEATLIGLKEADVGAIYLGDVGSSYTVKHGDEDMAKIARSSIYLTESGMPNTIHEVDLKL